MEPVPDSTKLRVSQEGLEVLRGVTGLVAPVVVIGPYRSGKSFLVNQMLGVPCGTLLSVGTGEVWQTEILANHPELPAI